MKQSGDFIQASQFSVGELREALFGRNPEISPTLAVNLLSRLSYPEKLADFEKVLDDSAQPAQVRYNAAVELSKIPSAEGRTILQKRANIDDAFVRRGVSIALANLGEASRPDLSGLLEGRFDLPATSYLAHPDAKRAEKIKVEAPPPISVGSIRRQITTLLPGVDFKPVLAQSLECKQRQTVLALNAAVSPEAVRSNVSTIVGVVMERFQLEADRWQLRYLVGTRGGKSRDEVEIFVASPSGQVIAAGAARLQGDEAAFEVTTIDLPGIVPFSIKGRYRSGLVTIDRATSDTVSRRRIEVAPRSPRPARPAE